MLDSLRKGRYELIENLNYRIVKVLDKTMSVLFFFKF